MRAMDATDFGLLSTLDALLQEASVTRAARRMSLSTPAMSHALARIRERLGDPVLVRSGRGMLLTPRAESLKARVHAIVEDARLTLAAEEAFVASDLSRTFVVHGSDYVLTVLGGVVDRILHVEAPGVCLRFMPNSPDDPVHLREGGSHLAVGIYGDLPQEMRSRALLTDRFVCVVREGHPVVGKRLSMKQFLDLPHIQVAPRGTPGGYVDDLLREKGWERKVSRAVPYFMTALQLTSQTDYLLTISERIAKQLAPRFGLKVLEAPLEMRPYALSLVWHPRFDGDAAHRFLREVFARAAREAAGDQHARPRTRLDTSDPASGQTRKRPRPMR